MCKKNAVLRSSGRDALLTIVLRVISVYFQLGVRMGTRLGTLWMVLALLLAWPTLGTAQEFAWSPRPLFDAGPVLDYSRRLLYCFEQQCSITIVFSQRDLLNEMAQHTRPMRVSLRRRLQDGTFAEQPLVIQVPRYPLVLGGCFGADLPPTSPADDASDITLLRTNGDLRRAK